MKTKEYVSWFRYASNSSSINQILFSTTDVRDTKTGHVRAVTGQTYMLKAQEELWQKDLPEEVEELLSVRHFFSSPRFISVWVLSANLSVELLPRRKRKKKPQGSRQNPRGVLPSAP